MENNSALFTSILQFAMEGKLVPQKADSFSEPFLSSFLSKKGKHLTKIVFEDGKYYEILNGKKKDISDEISVQIPSSWYYIRLIDLADKIEAGGTPSRSNSSYWNNGTIPWVKIGDMQSKYVNKTSEFITQEGLDNSTAKLLPKGTILYSIFASIGTTSFLNIEACTNQAITGLFFDESLNKEFIYYFLKNSSAYMLKQSHGTAQNNINQKILKNMFIPFPPMEEQERIVSKIHELEPLVEEFESLSLTRANLDAKLKSSLKASVLKYVMEGNITLSQKDNTSALDIYNSCKISLDKIRKSEMKRTKPIFNEEKNSIECDLRDIASVYGGKRVPKDMSWQDEPTAHRYIRVTDMKNQTVIFDRPKYISEEVFKVISRYTVKANDVYITVAGTIGDAGVIPPDCDGANLTENADKIILPKCIDPEWFSYQLNSDFIQKQIHDLKTQVAQPKLAIKRIESLRIRIIPYERQLKEVALIKSALKEIDLIND